MRSIIVVLVIALAACSPTPSPVHPDVPVGDAGPGCEGACSRLAALNCQEGIAPNCARVCQHTVDARLTNLKVGCIASATSVDAVRACGVLCR